MAKLDEFARNVFAGTSGWAYPTWKPAFYPTGTSAKKFLPFYASRLNSVEVNYTFRALPTAKMVAEWLAATGPGFRFSFKAPQRITHFNRLKDCAGPVSDFVAALEPFQQAGKLGVLLFQLPPNFKADADRLHALLALPALQSMRVAFEFRHESWFAPEMLEVLRTHGAGLCVAESDDFKTPEVHTAAAFACYRLRRTGGYTESEIEEWARRLSALAEAGREVYVYLKHEDDPTGALNAAALLETVRRPTG